MFSYKMSYSRITCKGLYSKTVYIFRSFNIHVANPVKFFLTILKNTYDIVNIASNDS